jgi:DNA-binding CsgD family transcriptional regulator
MLFFMVRPMNRAAQIKRLLKAGRSPKEIMEEIPSITGGTVTYWRKRLGLPSFRKGHPRGVRNKDTAAAVRRLKSEGLSYSQIGQKLGFSAQNACRYASAGKAVGNEPMQNSKKLPYVVGVALINNLHHSVTMLEEYPGDPEAEKLVTQLNNLIDRFHAKTQMPTSPRAGASRDRYHHQS